MGAGDAASWWCCSAHVCVRAASSMEGLGRVQAMWHRSDCVFTQEVVLRACDGGLVLGTDAVSSVFACAT